MKKLILIVLWVLLMCMPMVSTAQHHIYHNVYDTIIGLDTIYWRTPWYDKHFRPDTITDNHLTSSPWNIMAGDDLMLCNTERPIHVIGLAAMLAAHPDSPDQEIRPWEELDSTYEQEYIRLFQATPDGLELKLNFPFHVKDPYRILAFFNKYPRFCDTLYMSWWDYNRIYEYYTDKPITVYDSFYVGMTTYSCEDENHVHSSNDYVLRLEAFGHSPQCKIPDQVFRYVSRYPLTTATGVTLPAGYSRWMRSPSYRYIFPILLIDTFFVNPEETYVCPDVNRFRAAMTWESGGTLLWDIEARHRKWELRLCNAGGTPDQYVVDTCTELPYFTFEGLQNETHYNVYIRAVCEHYDDTLYSEWSDPLDLYTIVDIETPDISGGMVHLVPNPARNDVQVLSCFQLQRIEVYDINGKQVMDAKAEGVSATLRMGSLEKGTYIVLIHNQNGIYTKKLVLQ